jgi:hypothetical protein
MNAIPPDLRVLDSGSNGKLLEYRKDALITCCNGVWTQITTRKQSLRASTVISSTELAGTKPLLSL